MSSIVIPVDQFEMGSTKSSAEVFRKLKERFDWDQPGAFYMNAEAICEVLGIEPSKPNLTIVGRSVRSHFKVKTARTNSARLMLMPPAPAKKSETFL